MNWFVSLGNWFRPSRRREEAKADSAAAPVPYLSPNRPNSRLPRFSGNASDTDDIGRHTASPAAGRLSHAFTPSQPISDLRRFAGRADLLQKLIRTIEDRRMHVVLHGDRGLGKTSLLHILAILAQEARYLVRYTSCSEDSEFDEVFRSIAGDIRLLYHSEYDPTSPEAEKGLTLADTLGSRLLTPSTLSEAFAKLAGTRVLLILDEFDRASSPAFRKSIAELIKNLSDRSARVQIVIGGVAANLTELIEHIPSIRRNVLGIQVGPMNDEDLGSIIANAQDIGGITFAPDARALLLMAVNGSPYLVNLIGQQSARNALSRGATEISKDDVRGAVGEVDTELRSRLSPISLKQLFLIENALPAHALRDVGRYAQNNFGQLLAEHSKAITVALSQQGEKDWWSDAGDFRFIDDGIPVILWLSNFDDKTRVKEFALRPPTGIGQ